ncbi:hypothetical protein [Rhizobium leguminosarum]
MDIKILRELQADGRTTHIIAFL